jgi:hypothetical protein
VLFPVFDIEMAMVRGGNQLEIWLNCPDLILPTTLRALIPLPLKGVADIIAGRIIKQVFASSNDRAYAQTRADAINGREHLFFPVDLQRIGPGKTIAIVPTDRGVDDRCPPLPESLVSPTAKKIKPNWQANSFNLGLNRPNIGLKNHAMIPPSI